MGREEYCKQISLACVGSAHSVRTTLGCPSSWCLRFPCLTAQTPGCSEGELSGNQVLGEHTVPGGPCILMTSPVSATHFPRCPMCLLWKADLRLQPSWQMSTVQDPRKTWLATGSLLTAWWRMPSLVPRLPLAFQLWLSPACLSASGGGRKGVYRTS